MTGRRALTRYVVAGGLAAVSLVLTRLIWPVIEPTVSPLFLAAVVVSAWYGGLGPGLVATALGAVGKVYFFVVPTRSLFVEDAIGALHLALSVAIAILISSLTGALRHAEGENARLAERERAARADAEAANRAKDVFLATVSHELRTPLQALSTWLAVLRRRAPGDANEATALESIDRSVATLTRLIEDLLDVARIVSGKLQLEPVMVDVARVIEAAVARAEAAAPDGRVVVRLDLDHEPARVLGDATRLEQVVCNLVSNALKFTPAPGRVDVALRCAGPTVRVVVEDTGSGIAPDMLPHIFDEFRQDRQLRGDGLGLGLAIVRRLVALHGGTVTAHSDGPGRGARFVVELPAAAEAVPAAYHPSRAT